MIEPALLEQLNHKLSDAKTVAIFWHEYIDGDCIWSMLSMRSILTKLGKKVSCFTPIAPSKTFIFVKDISEIQTEFDYKEYDLLLFVDFTPYGRIAQFTENHETYFNTHTKVIIDHHLDTRQRWDLEIKDTNASSNCEWILEISQQLWPTLLDQHIATRLYLWLTTDTGNFFYEKDSKRTMKNALSLIELGADKYTIINNIFRKKSINAIQFMQLVLSRININKDILYSYYTDEECKHHQVDKEEAEFALPIIQSIAWPKVFILFKKVGDKLWASLRSQWDKINVSQIAKLFGGGGHFNASGFKVPFENNLSEQINTIINTIQENL